MKRFSIVLSILALIAGLVALYFTIAEILKRRGFSEDEDCDCCDCSCDDDAEEEPSEEEMDFIPETDEEDNTDK